MRDQFKTRPPLYSIVIPVLDEVEVLPMLFDRIASLMDSLDGESEVILVDDGSRDGSLALIMKQSADDPRFKYLRLSRNFGHQVAITAGLDHASGDAVVVIDADLQDPPEVIFQMIDQWKAGYDVVSGRRAERRGESRFKKTTAHVFYRLLNRLSDIEIPEDVGDFRLMDRSVVDALLSMRERNRYVRGMVSWVGFSHATVQYRRDSRDAGVTKYSLSKMITLGLNGILQFSTVPLQAISRLGLALSLLSFAAGVASVGFYLAGATVPGWTSLVVVAFFLGGVQLVVLGVIGGYVGRIYDEVRDRPLYVIQSSKGVVDDR